MLVFATQPFYLQEVRHPYLTRILSCLFFAHPGSTSVPFHRDTAIKDTGQLDYCSEKEFLFRKTTLSGLCKPSSGAEINDTGKARPAWVLWKLFALTCSFCCAFILRKKTKKVTRQKYLLGRTPLCVNNCSKCRPQDAKDSRNRKRVRGVSSCCLLRRLASFRCHTLTVLFYGTR